MPNAPAPVPAPTRRAKPLAKARPKTQGPRPLWQPPTVNARNGNPINGFFYAVIDGRKVSLRTQDEGEAWESLKSLLANSVQRAGESPTIGALANLRIDQAKRELPEKGYRGIAEILFDFVTGCRCKFAENGELTKGRRYHKGYGSMRLDEIKPLHAKLWLDAHPLWGQSTRSHRLGILRGLFNYAKSLGIIESSPIAAFKVPGVLRRFSYFDEEMEKLIYANTSDELGEFVWILINTGMRPFSEAAKVKAENIEINDDGRMRINLGTAHKTGRKTGKARIIYPSPDVAERIREKLLLYPRGSGHPLFCGRQSEVWLPRNAGWQFLKLKKKLGLDDMLRKKFGDRVSPVSLYSCRHTFATRAIPKIGLPKTAMLMGNTIRICERTYGHLECLHDDLYSAVGQ